MLGGDERTGDGAGGPREQSHGVPTLQSSSQGKGTEAMVSLAAERIRVRGTLSSRVLSYTDDLLENNQMIWVVT